MVRLTGPPGKLRIGMLLLQPLLAPVAQPVTLIVNSSSDFPINPDDGVTCSLRGAVVSINQGSAAQVACVSNSPYTPFGTDDQIRFSASVGSTLTLFLYTSLYLKEPVSIVGPGKDSLTISSSIPVYTFFAYEESTISGLTITSQAATSVFINNIASVALKDVSIRDSDYTNTGGVYVSPNATVYVVDSEISGNSGYRGGGIYVGKNAQAAVLGSTISGNSAGSGGGIFLYDGAIATIANSTISGNSAVFYGGGIFQDSGGSTVTLINSTISNNTAGLLGGGLLTTGISTVNMVNTLITGNTAPSDSEIARTVSPGFNLDGNNLLGDSSKTNAQAFYTGFSPGASDIVATSDGGLPTAVDQILLPLRAEGGPTRTHALPDSSPAVNAGDNAICGTGKLVPTDQRRQPRNDGRCDIGAYELIARVCFVVRSMSNKIVNFCL